MIRSGGCLNITDFETTIICLIILSHPPATSSSSYYLHLIFFCPSSLLTCCLLLSHRLPNSLLYLHNQPLFYLIVLYCPLFFSFPSSVSLDSSPHLPFRHVIFPSLPCLFIPSLPLSSLSYSPLAVALTSFFSPFFIFFLFFPFPPPLYSISHSSTYLPTVIPFIIPSHFNLLVFYFSFVFIF